MSVLGKGQNCYVLDTGVTSTVKAYIQQRPTDLQHARAVSFHLITEGASRNVQGTGTDAVVASTHTWTAANGAFATADVGGRLIVIGSQSNDGAYNITSRTSATVIVTDGFQTNETFSSAVTFIVVPPGTLDGSWKIEISNDFASAGSSFEMPPTKGTEHWFDLTSQFRDADGGQIATVAHATAATRNQFVQGTVMASRVIRATFTVSGGTGRALAIIAGGDYGN